jgi:hypothetical protein
MKINEVTQTQIPHLYLDMDGVQADFFGAWAKQHNQSHWKAVQNKAQEIEILAHSSPKEVYDFFINLEPLSGGKEVLKWIKQNNIPFTVLSAPLRGPYAQYSIQAKKDWLDKFNPGTSQSAIFTSEKFKYAKTNNTINVLVDDFSPYLQKWSDAGGVAVKHEEEHDDTKSYITTINTLEKIYAQFLDK